MEGSRRYRARDALRDQAFLVDTALGPVLFVAVNALFGLRAAGAAGVALAAVVVGARAMRREPVGNAVAGLIGVGIAVGIALGTGSASGYFWPRVAINAAWAIGFVVTVVVGRPAVAIFVRGLYRFPWSWLRHDRVRPPFAEVTLVWAAFFALKAALVAALILADATGALAAVSLALGWPAFLLLTVASYRYVGWRLAGLAAPEPWGEGDAP